MKVPDSTVLTGRDSEQPAHGIWLPPLSSCGSLANRAWSFQKALRGYHHSPTWFGGCSSARGSFLAIAPQLESGIGAARSTTDNSWLLGLAASK